MEGQTAEHTRQRGESERQRLQRVRAEIPGAAHGQPYVPGEQIAVLKSINQRLSCSSGARRCACSQRAIVRAPACLLCGVP